MLLEETRGQQRKVGAETQIQNSTFKETGAVTGTVGETSLLPGEVDNKGEKNSQTMLPYFIPNLDGRFLPLDHVSWLKHQFSRTDTIRQSRV